MYVIIFLNQTFKIEPGLLHVLQHVSLKRKKEYPHSFAVSGGQGSK